MAEFIAPVVDWVAGVLTGEALAAALVAAELETFAEVKKSWTGVAINWPPVAVMARSSRFDPEGTATHGTHELTVKFGVCGDDTDQVAADAMAYMLAIDRALTNERVLWLEQMSRVFVVRHDYGPLFQMDSSFAKFPELQLEVETQEL